MELITKLTNELDVEITRVWNEYLDFHDQLNAHRGKPIQDTNIQQVNDILKGIQDTFSMLYPAYNFIAQRHQHVTNAVNSHNDFIESIKTAGAKQEEIVNGVN